MAIGDLVAPAEDVKDTTITIQHGSLSQDETQALLKRIWPDGVPPAELALLRALPPRRAATVIARLAAIAAVEEGGAVAEAAADLGIDRVAFYRLRRKWDGTRSIRALTPFADKAPRRIAAGVLSGAEGMALEVVRAAAPNASARSMAASLAMRANGISEPTALRLVREARMSLSGDPDHLARTFGKVLLVDLSAVSLAVDLGRGSVVTPIVAVVMDRSSRLIIGHAAGPPDQAPALQRVAVSRAYAALAYHVGGVTDADGDPELEIVLAEGAEGAAATLRTLVAAPLLELASGGPRRFGQRLISLTGHRLGRLRLRPRATAAASPWNGSLSDLSHPPMPPADAVALIDEAVRDHNRARLVSLSPADGPVHWRGDAMGSFLERMAALIPGGRFASLQTALIRIDGALAGQV